MVTLNAISDCSASASEEVSSTISALHPSDRDVTDDRLRELMKFAREDEIYQVILQFVTKGFPNLKSEDMDEELRPYYRVREDLYSDSDGFLCRNGSFVVPKGLVKTYMERLLSMHQAACSCPFVSLVAVHGQGREYICQDVPTVRGSQTL